MATTTPVRAPPPLPHAEAAEEDGRARWPRSEDDAPAIGVVGGGWNRGDCEAAAEEVGRRSGWEGRIGSLRTRVTCDGVSLVTG